MSNGGIAIISDKSIHLTCVKYFLVYSIIPRDLNHSLPELKHTSRHTLLGNMQGLKKKKVSNRAIFVGILYIGAKNFLAIFYLTQQNHIKFLL